MKMKISFVSRRFSLICLFALVVVNGILAYVVIAPHDERLRISFLNVGQGDAIFIESPTGTQLLIDGGRDRSVLRELGKRVGILDRTIDIVIETHPDADHIGGLSGVFERYEIAHYVTPGIENDTGATKALQDAVQKEAGIETLLARRGMRIHLGGGAYADILYPDRDVSSVETNTGSVILQVVYGETEFLLTGDAPLAIEEWIVTLEGDSERLRSDVLKAGHHGSKTSTGDAWLSAVRPALVIISAGKDNSYGHPHEEVLARVREADARILSTAEEGTITLISDGESIRKK